MIALILILRLLHIISGAFWFGAVMVAVFFIEPTAKALGADGDRFMAHLVVRRRAAQIMAVAATTTIGAGAILYWIDSGGLQVAWITSHTGLAFTAGAIGALIAYAIAGLFLKPEVDRLARLRAGADPRDEVETPQNDDQAEHFERRLRFWSLIQVAVLVLAIAAMATARYIP